MEHTNEDIAKVWISYQIRSDSARHSGGKELGFEDSEWWSHEALMDMVGEDPDRAFAILDEIIARTDDEGALGLLGAGTLEDLFQTEGGSKYAPLVIGRARRDKRWRFAFGNVWTHFIADRELAAQLDAALDRFYPNGRL